MPVHTGRSILFEDDALDKKALRSLEDDGGGHDSSADEAEDGVSDDGSAIHGVPSFPGDPLTLPPKFFHSHAPIDFMK